MLHGNDSSCRPTSMRHACRRYAQAGTPNLKVATSYDAAARTYTITATQSTPSTPGQAQKGPVPIPLAVGLLARDGTDLPLTLQVPRAVVP